MQSHTPPASLTCHDSRISRISLTSLTHPTHLTHLTHSSHSSDPSLASHASPSSLINDTVTATHCNALQYIVSHSNTLQHPATQHTAQHTVRNDFSHLQPVRRRVRSRPRCRPALHTGPPSLRSFSTARGESRVFVFVCARVARCVAEC